MDKPEQRVVEFINEHHVLTFATSVDNKPYCANCFYVYLEEENWLIFTSDKTTKHGSDSIQNSRIAGSVVLETSTVGKIQGIQFTGNVEILEGEEKKKAKLRYLKKYPYAVLKQSELWAIKPNFIKMTDNRLGFGKKLLWGELD